MSCEMFLPDAWITLFARWLPFSLLWHVYRDIEAKGFPYVLCITVALLKQHEVALIAASDFPSLFVILKTLSEQPNQPDASQLLSLIDQLLPSCQEEVDKAMHIKTPRSYTSDFSRVGSCIVRNTTGVELLGCSWLAFTSFDVAAKVRSRTAEAGALLQDLGIGAYEASAFATKEISKFTIQVANTLTPKSPLSTPSPSIKSQQAQLTGPKTRRMACCRRHRSSQEGDQV